MQHHFLPDHDPLDHLPPPFASWEDLGKNLPKNLLNKEFKQRVLALPAFPMQALKTKAQEERAMQLLSYIGHAYVWGEKVIPQSIPAVLAKPWVEVSKKVGRLPVLSYASYALHNWKKLDSSKPIELGNIALIQNFLGGIDEEWFILVHVDIEAKAVPAMKSCLDAVRAVSDKNIQLLSQSLTTIKESMEKICSTMDRMPEHCDPYIYYHRVRPYIHGWKNHPSFPNGLIYDGVTEYEQKPQHFRGETGAQSAIVPTLDGLFGITHANDDLRHYLLEMRDYMPPAHREFVEYIEANSEVRKFVKKYVKEYPYLKEIYNQCVQLIERFRQTHLAYAASYIQKQHQESSGNPNAVGTGGTPFMSYLKKHKDETEKFLI